MATWVEVARPRPHDYDRPGRVPLIEILLAEDLPNLLDVLGSNEQLLLDTSGVRTGRHVRRQELHLETFGSASLRDHVGAKDVAPTGSATTSPANWASPEGFRRRLHHRPVSDPAMPP
jgi:hypothetical protein